jgi:hypothetical protein
MRKIELQQLSTLHVQDGGQRRPVSSASGLCRVGQYLYCIGDDELQVAVFDQNMHGVLHRLLPGTLPQDHQDRKTVKPDLEAMLEVCVGSQKSLLFVPSGSAANRTVGALCKLDPAGRISDTTIVDWSVLYSNLSRALGVLDIEGAVVCRQSLVLMQRGNGADVVNAVINIELPPLIEQLSRGQALNAPIQSVQAVDLGTLEGIRLGFTDATVIGEDLLFVAAAEDTDNPYDDGRCTGSVLGLYSKAQGLVLGQLESPWKIEGIHAEEHHGIIKMLMVTDADDPAQASVLLEGSITTADLHTAIVSAVRG